MSLRQTIIDNEGYAGVIGKDQSHRKIGQSDYGTYIGLGSGPSVQRAYERAGVTPEMAGDLYGKELVVGYGHMLRGDELRSYFTDETARSKFDNYSLEQAEDTLTADIPRYQEDARRVAKNKGVDIDSLSPAQQETLTEMTFQIGSSTFSSFNNFWKAMEQGDYEEAAKEIKRGRTPNSTSALYQQTPQRAEDYMKGIQSVESIDNTVIIDEPTEELIPAEEVLEPEVDVIEPIQESPPEELNLKPEDGVMLADTGIPPVYETPEELPADFTDFDEAPDELPADFQGFEETPDELPVDFAEFDETPSELPADFTGFDDTATGSGNQQYNQMVESGMTPEEIEAQIVRDSYKTPTPADGTPRVGAAEAATSGFAQGYTFGFSEPISAFAYATEEKLRGSDVSFNELYNRGKIAAKQIEHESTEDRPWLTGATTMIGGLASGLTAPAALGVKGVTAGSAMGYGALEGGVAGLGFSEEGEELSGAATGAGLGVAGAGVMAGISKAYKALKGPSTVSAVKESDALSDLVPRVETKRATNQTADDYLAATFKEETLEDILLSTDGAVRSASPEVLEAYNQKLMADAKRRRPYYDIDTDYEQQYADIVTELAEDTRAVQTPLAFNEKTLVSDSTAVAGSAPSVTPDDLRRQANASALRSDMIQYMEYVTKGPDKLANYTDLSYMAPQKSEKYLRNLSNNFKEASRRGAVNKESFDEFLNYKYTGESIRDIRDEYVERAFTEDLVQKYAARGKDISDIEPSSGTAYAASQSKDIKRLANPELPEIRAYQSKEWSEALDARIKQIRESKQGKRFEEEFDQLLRDSDVSDLRKKMTETNLLFREIDRKTGLDTEILQNNAYQAANKKAFWEINQYRNVRSVEQAMRKAGLESEELYDLVKMADKGGISSVPDSAKEAVESVVRLNKELLEASRAGGLDIADRGPYYVPKQKKTGARYIKSMEDFYTEQYLNLPERGRVLKLLNKNSDLDLEEKIGSLKPRSREMAAFLYEIRKATGLKRLTDDDVRSFFQRKVLRSDPNIARAAEVDANVLYKQNPLIADFLIDKRINTIYRNNISQAGTLIHMEPVGRALDNRAALLREMGKIRSAKAIENYRKDITNQYRNKLSSGTKDWIERAKIKYGIERVENLEALWNMMTNSIYPNLVGGVNPVGLIRNLTQPMTKTIPEMGIINPLRVGKAYLKAVKTLSNPKAIRELEVAGILPSDVSDMISVKPETLTGAGGRLYEGVESFNNVMMSAFNKTDTINRIVTYELAQDMAKEIAKGSKLGRTVVKNLPPRLAREAAEYSSTWRNAAQRTEFERKLANHYAVQTQLAYGVTGNSELVRDMGRIASMLSKWPTQVGSDIHAHALRKEWGRIGAKYGAPWLVATIAAGVLSPEEGEEEPMEEFLLGKKRGADWTGINAVTNINITPPILDGILGTTVGVADLSTGIISGDKEKARSGSKAVGRGITQFVPVLGAAWSAHGRIQRAFGSEDLGRSENLLLPEDMEFNE